MSSPGFAEAHAAVISTIDCTYSGSTAAAVLLRRSGESDAPSMVTAWVGDSRVVLATAGEGGALEAIDITKVFQHV